MRPKRQFLQFWGEIFLEKVNYLYIYTIYKKYFYLSDRNRQNFSSIRFSKKIKILGYGDFDRCEENLYFLYPLLITSYEFFYALMQSTSPYTEQMYGSR